MATAAAAVPLSFILVGIVRKYASALSLVDVPNERSSHAIPTPRGGGAGAVVCALVLLVTLPTRGNAPLMIALGGVVIAGIIGWIDDRGHAPVRVRLAAHLVAAALVLPLAIGSSTHHHPIVFAALAVMWIVLTVSAINVVNFMDGIDGLIALQLLVLSFHFGVLSSPASGERLFATILGGSALGFLVWNWPPARIFLGDAGSGALGVLGIIGAALLGRAGNPLLGILLPLYPLCLDSLLTIVRRRRRGEDVTSAHRSHLYQRLANGGWGHARVTLLYAAAAAVGSLVATSSPAGRLLPAAIGFGGIVLAIGIALDRRAPHFAAAISQSRVSAPPAPVRDS